MVSSGSESDWNSSHSESSSCSSDNSDAVPIRRPGTFSTIINEDNKSPGSKPWTESKSMHKTRLNLTRNTTHTLSLLSAETRLKRAVLCVQDALDHSYPRLHFLSNKRLWWAQITRFRTYQFVLYAFNLWQMFLVLWEPTSLRDESYSDKHIQGLASMELVIIIMYIVDIWINTYIWQKKYFHYFWHKVRIVVVFLMILDIILTLISPNQFYRFSRPLRPFILISFSKQLRNMVTSIVSTMVRVLDVVLFLVMLIVFWGFAGMHLFEGLYLDKDSGKPLDGNFETISDSFLSLFVLLTTENYPDIMYPAYEETPWSLIFFMSFIIIGCLLFVNCLVAVVYDAYKDKIKLDLGDKMLKEWTSLTAAFEYLDMDQDGLLDLEEWTTLLNKLDDTIPQHTTHLYFNLMDGNGDGMIDLLEFLELGEMMLLKVSLHSANEGKCCCFQSQIVADKLDHCIAESYCTTNLECLSRRASIERLVKSRWFKNIITVCITANTVTLCLSGYDWVNEDVLGALDWFFILIFTAEIALKFVGIGLCDFWRSSWNVMDFVLIFSSLLMQLVSAEDDSVASWAIPVRLGRLTRVARLFRMLRLVRSLRLISTARRLRVLFLTLVGVGPLFLTLIRVVNCMLYCYALVGMELFSGLFSAAYDEGYENAHSHFDDFGSSMLTLFQIVTTSNWHEVMYAGVKARKDIGVEWFFVSFYIFVVLVVLNLLVGLILEMYSALKDQQSSSKQENTGEEEDNVILHCSLSTDSSPTPQNVSRNPSAYSAAGSFFDDPSFTKTNGEHFQTLVVEKKNVFERMVVQDELDDIRKANKEKFTELRSIISPRGLISPPVSRSTTFHRSSTFTYQMPEDQMSFRESRKNKSSRRSERRTDLDAVLRGNTLPLPQRFGPSLSGTPQNLSDQTDYDSEDEEKPELNDSVHGKADSNDSQSMSDKKQDVPREQSPRSKHDNGEVQAGEKLDRQDPINANDQKIEANDKKAVENKSTYDKIMEEALGDNGTNYSRPRPKRADLERSKSFSSFLAHYEAARLRKKATLRKGKSKHGKRGRNGKRPTKHEDGKTHRRRIRRTSQFYSDQLQKAILSNMSRARGKLLAKWANQTPLHMRNLSHRKVLEPGDIAEMDPMERRRYFLRQRPASLRNLCDRRSRKRRSRLPRFHQSSSHLTTGSMGSAGKNVDTNMLELDELRYMIAKHKDKGTKLVDTKSKVAQVPSIPIQAATDSPIRGLSKVPRVFATQMQKERRKHHQQFLMTKLKLKLQALYAFRLPILRKDAEEDTTYLNDDEARMLSTVWSTILEDATGEQEDKIAAEEDHGANYGESEPDQTRDRQADHDQKPSSEDHDSQFDSPPLIRQRSLPTVLSQGTDEKTTVRDIDQLEKTRHEEWGNTDTNRLYPEKLLHETASVHKENDNLENSDDASTSNLNPVPRQLKSSMKKQFREDTTVPLDEPHQDKKHNRKMKRAVSFSTSIDQCP